MAAATSNIVVLWLEKCMVAIDVCQRKSQGYTSKRLAHILGSWFWQSLDVDFNVVMLRCGANVAV